VAPGVTQHWSVAAVPAAVPQLRSAIADFAARAGMTDPPLADVKLAISEALANVVLHGYRDRPEPGRIEVDADFTGTELRIVIADRGVGMRPRIDSPGAGLGLPIIAQVAGGLEIREGDPHGTELHLCFSA